MPEIDTESVYLDLYDDFVDQAEYLQSDDENRHLLPAAFIVGGLFWALAAFATGFFNHLGERTADFALAKITSLTHHKSQELTPEQVIELLRTLAPYLPLLEKSNEEERRTQEQWVSSELERNSFPPDTARKLAKAIVDHLRQAGSSS